MQPAQQVHMFYWQV